MVPGTRVGVPASAGGRVEAENRLKPGLKLVAIRLQWFEDNRLFFAFRWLHQAELY